MWLPPPRTIPRHTVHNSPSRRGRIQQWDIPHTPVVCYGEEEEKSVFRKSFCVEEGEGVLNEALDYLNRQEVGKGKRKMENGKWTISVCTLRITLFPESEMSKPPPWSNARWVGAFSNAFMAKSPSPLYPASNVPDPATVVTTPNTLTFQ